jgi:hypothetical protein
MDEDGWNGRHGEWMRMDGTIDTENNLSVLTGQVVLCVCVCICNFGEGGHVI